MVVLPRRWGPAGPNNFRRRTSNETSVQRDAIVIALHRSRTAMTGELLTSSKIDRLQPMADMSRSKTILRTTSGHTGGRAAIGGSYYAVMVRPAGLTALALPAHAAQTCSASTQ